MSSLFFLQVDRETKVVEGGSGQEEAGQGEMRGHQLYQGHIAKEDWAGRLDRINYLQQIAVFIHISRCRPAQKRRRTKRRRRAWRYGGRYVQQGQHRVQQAARLRCDIFRGAQQVLPSPKRRRKQKVRRRKRRKGEKEEAKRRREKTNRNHLIRSLMLLCTS